MKNTILVLAIASMSIAPIFANAAVSSARSFSSPSRSYSSSSTRSYSSPSRSYSSTTRSYTSKTSTAPKIALLSSSSSSKKKKRSSSAVEYEYFPFRDCARIVRVDFNGYRCIDRD